MIDVVLPLGKGSKHNNLELRYSLRSLEKYVEFGNVFIIGERPSWLNDNVIHIPHPDTTGNFALNIMRKIVAACEDERVSPEFLYLNDDYFFTAPVDPATYPYYWKCDLLHTISINKSDYKKFAKSTWRALTEKGLPTKNFDVHYPTRIQKEALLSVVEQYDWSKPFSPTLKSIYCNTLGIEGIQRPDCKAVHAKGKDWWHEFATRQEVFSIHDPCITPAFKQFLQEYYPSESKFEILKAVTLHRGKE